MSTQWYVTIYTSSPVQSIRLGERVTEECINQRNTNLWSQCLTLFIFLRSSCLRRHDLGIWVNKLSILLAPCKVLIVKNWTKQGMSLDILKVACCAYLLHCRAATTVSWSRILSDWHHAQGRAWQNQDDCSKWLSSWRHPILQAEELDRMEDHDMQTTDSLIG